MDITELYHDLILDHGTNPKNFFKLEAATNKACGHNPICGDKITVYLDVNNNKIDKISFDGNGCAISIASASLLTENLQGKSIKEAEKLFSKFEQMLTTDNINLESLGKLEALANVKNFPARVKCATLAWHTLISALKNDVENDHITTER